MKTTTKKKKALNEGGGNTTTPANWSYVDKDAYATKLAELFGHKSNVTVEYAETATIPHALKAEQEASQGHQWWIGIMELEDFDLGCIWFDDREGHPFKLMLEAIRDGANRLNALADELEKRGAP